jgi:hypothetical protein
MKSIQIIENECCKNNSDDGPENRRVKIHATNPFPDEIDARNIPGMLKSCVPPVSGDDA